jgi:predicted CoA-substrate-specific enzyme activase
MYYGIDIGSTYIKIIGMDKEKNILEKVVLSTLAGAQDTVSTYLQDKNVEGIIFTGYGRYMIDSFEKSKVVSEIQAHAKGITYFFDNVEVVIDIGGQDSKVILLGDNGSFIDFKMNDKCAAGTGKFLEIAASRLGYSLDDFGLNCQNPTKEVEINSMCAVFAESEVISLVAKKETPQNIGYGVHMSIGTRVANMAKSMARGRVTAFSGGAAQNQLLAKILSQELESDILVPQYPQFVGAIGACMLAVK